MVESSCKVTHLSTSVPVHAGSTGSSSSYVYGSVNVVFSTITRTLPRLLSLPSATSAHTVVGIRLSAMTSARKSETMRFFICRFLLVIFSARYINAFRPCCPCLPAGRGGGRGPAWPLPPLWKADGLRSDRHGLTKIRVLRVPPHTKKRRSSACAENQRVPQEKSTDVSVIGNISAYPCLVHITHGESARCCRPSSM